MATCRPRGLVPPPRTKPTDTTATSTTPSAPIAAAIRRRSVGAAGAVPTVVDEVTPSADRSSVTKAAQLANRSPGDLAMPRASTASTGGRKVGPSRGSGRRRVAQDGRDQRRLAVTLEGLLSGEGPEGDRGQGVLVGRAIDVPALELFRGHGVERAHDRPDPCQRRVLGAQLGQSEVGQVGVLAALVASCRGDEDVAGLHIAMDEAVGMCGIEGAGDLAQEVDDLPRLERSIPKPRLQVRALDIAHGDEQDALDLAGLVDGQDVGVVDGGRHLRLALESGPVVEVVRQGGWQDLERHAPLESALLRAVHDAHAATPDDRLDPIRPEVRADARVGTRRGHGAMNWATL